MFIKRKMMFRRFLSGLISCTTFVSMLDKDIRYFPEEIYRNDWKTIGNDIRNIIKSNKVKEKNE